MAARTRRLDRARDRRRRRRRRALILVPLGLLLALLAFIGFTYAFVEIPKPSDVVSAQSAIVLDRIGRLVGRVHAGADRVDIPLKQVPGHLRKAVIAAEDRRFYTHPGVSIPDVIRAAVTNLANLDVEQGGSTITQQYVKNAFVGRERSIWRKMKEAVLSLKLERERSKDEILELYLNAVYFGRGAYGVEAAARTYFGVPARRVTPAQGALLASLIRAPEAFDPQRDLDAATRRRDRVLDEMVRAGLAGRWEADRAKDEAVRVRARSGGFAAYVLAAVRRELERELGPARLYRGGLRIETTIDLDAQRAAERAVRDVLDRRDDPDAALVALDPRSGAIRALVGGRNFARQPFDVATQGRRQAGSAFKPFVLATALERDVSLRERFPAPAQATFATDAGPWRVRTFDGKGYGTIDLVRATEQSVNTVYARLILRIGPERVAELARRAGITSRLDAVPSLTLGTSPVSPLELVSGYATFANRGVARRPFIVQEVRDRSGRVLLKAESRGERAVPERVAACMNFALESVARNGTGRSAQIGREIAVKTGTTEEHVDAWLVGYTPELAAGVWMGFAKGGRTMEDVRGIAVTGSSFPARIWRAFMAEALRGTPTRPLVASEECGAPSASPLGSASPVAPATLTPTPTGSPTPTRSSSPRPSPMPTSSPPPSPSAPPSPTSSPSPTAG